MNVHKNARLTPRGREILVSRLKRGEHPQDVGTAMGASASTVYKWRRQGETFQPVGGILQAIHGCRGAGQYATTLRYRCQAACPITGKATARPTKTGKAPMNRVAAMMKPHIPIIIGFARTALIDV